VRVCRRERVKDKERLRRKLLVTVRYKKKDRKGQEEAERDREG